MKKWFLLLLVVIGGWQVQSLNAQEATVYGVFFYSPSCLHCHEVIDNHWDDIQSEFGEQLKVLFINIQYPVGSQLMTETTRTMGIASNGVPMLVLGHEALIGSVEIPTKTAQIVRDGLANGGIDIPNVAGMEAIFSDALGDDYVPNLAVTEPANDIANQIAVGLLVTLIVSLAFVGFAFVSRPVRRLVTASLGYATVFYVLVGIGLTISLVLGSNQVLITLLASIMMALFVFTLVNLRVSKDPPPYLVPVVLLIGLLVASYMAYIEITLNEAVCGTIGACNVVQQSDYAFIWGIPIGVIGIIGYLALLILWVFSRKMAQLESLLVLLSVGGVGFSIYLTYLEPFVIGASCVWCLTSAVCMALLLLLLIPQQLEQRFPQSAVS